MGCLCVAPLRSSSALPQFDWVHKKLTGHLNPEAPSQPDPDTRKTIQPTVAIRLTAATARTRSSRIGSFRGSLTAWGLHGEVAYAGTLFEVRSRVMLRSGATLLVILKWLGAAHHYERSPSTNCIKQLTSDRWCEKRKSPDRDRDFQVIEFNREECSTRRG
jgi:hypothetical protein